MDPVSKILGTEAHKYPPIKSQCKYCGYKGKGFDVYYIPTTKDDFEVCPKCRRRS